MTRTCHVGHIPIQFIDSHIIYHPYIILLTIPTCDLDHSVDTIIQIIQEIPSKKNLLAQTDIQKDKQTHGKGDYDRMPPF